MAKMYTTSKTNPITGMSTDNNPRQEARQEKRQVRREEKALNKSLNEGIKKQKVDRSIKTISYRGTAPSETPKQKDWRDKAKADKGGKKGVVVKGGKGGRANYNKMDESCKNPYAK
jgi:hypothetical protein